MMADCVQILYIRVFGTANLTVEIVDFLYIQCDCCGVSLVRNLPYIQYEIEISDFIQM